MALCHLVQLSFHCFVKTAAFIAAADCGSADQDEKDENDVTDDNGTEHQAAKRWHFRHFFVFRGSAPGCSM